MIQIDAIVPSLKVGNVSHNVKEIQHWMLDQKDHGILVFPELCLTGASCQDVFFQSRLLSQVEEGLSSILETSKNIPSSTVVVGAPLRYQQLLYDCAIVICNGEILGIVPKQRASRWFSSGEKIIGQEMNLFGQLIPFGRDLLFQDENTGASMYVIVGDDIDQMDCDATHASIAGANIIVNPTAIPSTIHQFENIQIKLHSYSKQIHSVVVLCSAGMSESTTDYVYSGITGIYENGTCVDCSDMEHGLISGIVDLETIAYARRNDVDEFEDYAWYRSIDTRIQPILGKDEITVNELSHFLKTYVDMDAYPFLEDDPILAYDTMEQALLIQASGLVGRLKAIRSNTVILGVSGGLDSTLALLVCDRARMYLPDLRILGYTMPTKGNTSSETKKNAWALMKAFDIEGKEISIEKELKIHLEEIGHPGTYQGNFDTTYENAQARIRTMILMDIANMEHGIVVGTGDLSELALGWCTYNGDQMSMYGVNSSIPKTMVRQMCQTYMASCDSKEQREVLEKIVDTPISPELTPIKEGGIAQKTEELIGSYDINDFILYHILQNGCSPEKLLAYLVVAFPTEKKADLKKALLNFFTRFFQQQFKRSALPDGPKVTEISLSPRNGYCLPSDFSIDGWLERIKKA